MCVCVCPQYERQLAEYQEKSVRLQRRLTQAEQRATVVTQQVWADLLWNTQRKQGGL